MSNYKLKDYTQEERSNLINKIMAKLLKGREFRDSFTQQLRAEIETDFEDFYSNTLLSDYWITREKALENSCDAEERVSKGEDVDEVLKEEKKELSDEERKNLAIQYIKEYEDTPLIKMPLDKEKIVVDWMYSLCNVSESQRKQIQRERISYRKENSSLTFKEYINWLNERMKKE